MGNPKGGRGRAGAGVGKVGAGMLSSAAKKFRNRRQLPGGAKKTPPPKLKSGPVDLKVPTWATKAEKAQFAEYVKGANDANRKGLLSKNGKVASGASGARKAAEREARLERARAKRAGNPYKGVAAHIPDATWLGHGKPHQWGDHSKRVNSSIAGQQNRYPDGYKPTRFRLK